MQQSDTANHSIAQIKLAALAVVTTGFSILLPNQALDCFSQRLSIAGFLMSREIDMSNRPNIPSKTKCDL